LKKSLRNAIKTILFLFITVALLWLSFRGINFHKLGETIKKANYWFLILSSAASVIAFFIRARRWDLLIEPLGYTPGFINTYHSVTIGYLANLILPRLGEVAKCVALGKKERIPFDKLVGTIIVERTIDILTLGILLGLMLLAGSTTTGSFLSENVIDPAKQKVSSLLLIFIIFIVVTGLVFILYFTLKKNYSHKPFFKRIYSFVDGIYEGFKSIVRLKRKWEFIFLTILLWSIYLLMAYIPLFCLDSTSSLGMGGAMFVLIVGSFGMAVPVQSGLGAYHWIVSRGLLVAYKIPLEEGLAYATISHESQLLVIAVVGVISLFILFGNEGGKILSSIGKGNNV
jgi:glycosyltransferase 2 family protein